MVGLLGLLVVAGTEAVTIPASPPTVAANITALARSARGRRRRVLLVALALLVLGPRRRCGVVPRTRRARRRLVGGPGHLRRRGLGGGAPRRVLADKDIGRVRIPRRCLRNASRAGGLLTASRAGGLLTFHDGDSVDLKGGQHTLVADDRRLDSRLGDTSARRPPRLGRGGLGDRTCLDAGGPQDAVDQLGLLGSRRWLEAQRVGDGVELVTLLGL